MTDVKQVAAPHGTEVYGELGRGVQCVEVRFTEGKGRGDQLVLGVV